MISVIIPFYNHWDLTHARLLELFSYLPDGNEIILVDDASTEDDVRSGSAWWQKHSARHKVRYHLNETNLGFIGSMNAGAEVAIRNHADILVFQSNDVVISEDIFTEIGRIVAQYNGKVLVGGKLLDWKTGWNDFVDETGHTVIVPYLEGWLLACSADAWKELGGFDPAYGISDYEDIDLSLTAISLGYNLIALNSAYVKHLVAKSFGYNEAREKRTLRNKEIFRLKWKERLTELHDQLIVQTR